MNDQLNTLKKLIGSSERILITSHISPDPDALSSVLLAGTGIETNFPDKKVLMSMEELTGDLNFLSGYDKMVHQPFITSLKELKPDLIIIVDAMNFGRVSRGDDNDIKQAVSNLGSKLAIIDHHEPDGVEKNDVYINNQSPSCAQDCYEIFIKGFDKKPVGYAQTAMLGIISDTNRFMYDNPNHSKTFDTVDELLDAGASIEQIENLSSRFSIDDMMVLGELAKNVNVATDYTYSYLPDDFINQWLQKNKTAGDLKRGSGYFINEFVRNINGNTWGFMVYRDIATDEKVYSVSFRAVSGSKDVSQIAKKLSGGGHKSSAGAKIMANSVEDAIDMVKTTIASLA
jgi:nanoRNase/pAp phosphatase (c-di-AMP/oligoRNAs hydrolase)